jgi:hypothetical protein
MCPVAGFCVNALLVGITLPRRDHAFARPGGICMTESRSRSYSKLSLGIFIGVLVTLAVLAGVAVYVIGCTLTKVGDALQTDTKVVVNATTANGLPELNLTYGKEATGIVTITFSGGDGNKLWEVAGQGSAKPAKLVYGQLPADGSLKQIHPENGSPPADVRGQTVQVRVVNRFQVAFGPGQEVADVTVVVPK